MADARDARMLVIAAALGGALTARSVVGQSGPAPHTAARLEGVARSGLHYIVEGSGPPVVLIHAFQMDAREWDEVAPRLARARRVIRYDVRGHGRSGGAPQPTAAHEDLRDLLDELGVLRADVVGVSMGSGIALDAALAYPERIGRVVLVSPSVAGIATAVDVTWMQPIVQAVRAGDHARAAALWWESQIMAGVRDRGPGGVRYRQVVLENARIWGESPASRVLLDPPAGRRLEGVRSPMLVVVGERDDAGYRRTADTLVRRVPAARSTIIPGARHMVSIERPAELASAIEAFLAVPSPPRE